MSIHDLIRTRRTVQDFAHTEVDEAIVDRALAAAHNAPCHKLTWPWRFTKVGRATREAFVPTALELQSLKRSAPLPAGAVDKITAKLVNPAWLVVVTQVRADDPERRREDYAACATAVQNMQLALHAEGVGSKWGSGGLTRHPTVLDMLGVDGTLEDMVGFIWIGHPAREPKPVPRPALDATFVRSLP